LNLFTGGLSGTAIPVGASATGRALFGTIGRRQSTGDIVTALGTGIIGDTGTTLDIVTALGTGIIGDTGTTLGIGATLVAGTTSDTGITRGAGYSVLLPGPAVAAILYAARWSRPTPAMISSVPPSCANPKGCLNQKWSIAAIRIYATDTVGNATEIVTCRSTVT
jgi:hypothetical protein